MRDFHLLVDGHGRASRLLAISKRRIEDEDPVLLLLAILGLLLTHDALSPRTPNVDRNRLVRMHAPQGSRRLERVCERNRLL